MPQPLLSRRSCAKLTPLIDVFTCIECERPCTGFPHDDGRRSYDYACPCGALYRFRFSRNNWRWFMLLEFEAHGRTWTMRYEPWEGKTWFLRWTDSGFDQHEFQGYVHHERFSKLLVFA